MKPKFEKPACPMCGKTMRLLSTGSLVRTFFCDDCKKVEIIDRKDIEKKVDKT